jgi:RHS repeat-associated protein
MSSRTTEFDVCAFRSTGKERDSESGNDYFGARYYASTMGRFMSPDWAAKGYTRSLRSVTGSPIAESVQLCSQ